MDYVGPGGSSLVEFEHTFDRSSTREHCLWGGDREDVSGFIRAKGVVVVSVEVLGEVTVGDAKLIVGRLQSQISGLSGSAASVWLAEVAGLAAMVDAFRVGLVAAIDTSEVWRESNPNATAASFLREQHTLDHGQARADLRAAESFDRFPVLGDACREGRVSRDKADLILSFGLRNATREAVFGEFVGIFTELAPDVTPRQLKETLVMWADQVDPVTTNTDEDAAHQRRELHVNRVGDGVKIDGFFGPDQGLKVMAAINAALTLHRRGENETSSQADPVVGESLDSYRMVNSSSIARADAFIESIIDPVLESGLLPTCGGAPATVCVTLPMGRLQNPEQAADPVDVKTWLADGSLRDRGGHARATNGPGAATVSGVKAQQLACDATIQRVVLSPTGKPLDIGRRTRVIPEQIRIALVIRDRGCVFPYCDKPAGWAEGHHIQHWSQGGSTSLANLVLLCSRHHHQVHAEHIPIEFNPDGKPRVVLEHRFRDRL